MPHLMRFTPLEFVKTLFFSPSCLLCNLHPADKNKSICYACYTDIDVIHECIEIPYDTLTTNKQTNQHLATPLSSPSETNAKKILRITAACNYAFPTNEVILAFKYRDNLALLAVIVDLMLTLEKPRSRTLLVPVPSSHRRLKERGYDHTLLVAKRLSDAWNIPLWHGVKRTGDAPPQKGLSRAARLDNMVGQFELTQLPPTGYDILLIDDVCTTGSTLAALATILSPSKLNVSAYVCAHKFGN